MNVKAELLVCDICCVLEGKVYRGVHTIPAEVVQRLMSSSINGSRLTYLPAADYSCDDDIPGGPSLASAAQVSCPSYMNTLFIFWSPNPSLIICVLLYCQGHS